MRQPAVRGVKYLTDGVKYRQPGSPMLQLCAAQVVELKDGLAHRAGATAALIKGGGLVPPSQTRFMLSVYFMNPTPPQSAKPHAVLLHFSSDQHPSKASGPGASLLQELWSGDAKSALSRFKLVTLLHDGPTVLRTALQWAGIDDARPLLLCRALSSSLHRTSFAELGGLEHVELAVNVAGSWIAAGVYRAAFSAVTTVDVGLAFVLEGRSAEELPEVALAQVNVRGLEPAKTAWPPHAAWPTTAAAIPGTTFGPFKRCEIDEAIARLSHAKSENASNKQPSAAVLHTS